MTARHINPVKIRLRAQFCTESRSAGGLLAYLFFVKSEILAFPQVTPVGNTAARIPSFNAMAAGSPQKKRKTERESEDHSDEPSDNEGAASSREMDVDTSNGTSNADSNGHQRGKKRGTNKTILALRDTAKLTQMYEYKSNVFRMETDELLAEVKVDYKKRMGSVEKALHRLKRIIDSIPAKEPAMVSRMPTSGHRTPKARLTRGS